MKRKYVGLHLGMLLLGCMAMKGQQASHNDLFYNWFDKQVGIENTGLYEGIVYKEQYRTINENTQFYRSPDFLPGSVVYKGQPYANLLLKFNVYADELLLKVESHLGGNTLQLFSDKVSEFTIDGVPFVHIFNVGADQDLSGFYEVSYQDPAITLLTRYSKKLFSRKDRRSVYYEFLEGKMDYILHYREHYYSMDSKRDIIALFPGLKGEINDFYNRARAQRRTNPHAFTIALMRRIGSLLPQPNSDPIR